MHTANWSIFYVLFICRLSSQINNRLQSKVERNYLIKKNPELQNVA
jgi:hypothetical protein